MFRFAVAIGLLALSGCSGSSSVGRSDGSPYGLMIVNPEQRVADQRWIYADFSTFRENGIVKRMDVAFSFVPSKRNGVAEIDFPEPERKVLADNLSAGPRARKAVIQKYAVAMARQTFCRTGPVNLNRKMRRISDPQEIQKIVDASGGQILGTQVPPGTKSVAVQPIEYVDSTTKRSHKGRPTWKVRLTCDSPYPY